MAAQLRRHPLKEYDRSMQTPLEYFKFDKTAFRVYSSFEEADNAAFDHWLSRPPQERLAAVEFYRMIYHDGYDPTTASIPRIFRVIKRGES
ncbi:MAG: hypothetical protein ACWGMZ_00050 [Thermoguttaceae bacterium]